MTLIMVLPQERIYIFKSVAHFTRNSEISAQTLKTCILNSTVTNSESYCKNLQSKLNASVLHLIITLKNDITLNEEDKL